MMAGPGGTKSGPGAAKLHPAIFGYLKRYQEDPGSRAFAPLAEAYRKSGLVDEAIEIAREGLKVHPGFAGGRVALARALFDKKDFAGVVVELQTVARDSPDNLVAQKLLAESHLMLGQVAEALSHYKLLLFFTPQDEEAARIVQELEAQAYEEGRLVLRTDPGVAADAGLYEVADAQDAIVNSPEARARAKGRKLDRLLGLMQKVERYRVRN